MLAKTATEAIKKAEEAMAVANEARFAAEKAAQQQLATEEAAHQEAAAAVQQRAATSVLEETSMNQKELVDDKASAAS